MAKMKITDADVMRAMIREAVNIESRIEELEASPYVKLARQFEATKGRRLQYLQDLKQLERTGRRLHEAGWEVDEDAEDEEGL